MPDEMKIVLPTDPDFKELLESGRLVSGADIQALWHAWNAGEIPDHAHGDELVQPKSRSDLSEAELEAIPRCVEQHIAHNGVPSDVDPVKEIGNMNDTAPK